MHYLNESIIDRIEEMMGKDEESKQGIYKDLLRICYRISTELLAMAYNRDHRAQLNSLENCLLLAGKLKTLIIQLSEQGMIPEKEDLIHDVGRFRMKVREFRKYRELTGTLWAGR